MEKIKEFINRMLQLFALDDDDEEDEWIQNALYKPEVASAKSECGTLNGLQENEYHDYQIFVIPLKVEIDDDVQRQFFDLCVDKESLLKCIEHNTKCTEADIFIPGLVATFNNLVTPKYMRDLMVMADCYFTENTKIRIMAYEEQPTESIKKDGHLFVPFICKTGGILNDIDKSRGLLAFDGVDWSGTQLFSKSGKKIEGIRFKAMDLYMSISKSGGEAATFISNTLMVDPKVSVCVDVN